MIALGVLLSPLATPPAWAGGGPWSSIEPRVRRALEAKLGRTKTRRLLRRSAVRKTLQEVFEGFDGTDDELSVILDGNELVLHVVVREQRERCFEVGGGTFEDPKPRRVCS